ncbi:hypothetical protein [Haloarchaeobius sp. DYHT-AS-18]|uniref:hypothetical protein n=1 Tax=Haloarchaeobius sp. DYHT-AS-18 TaxID=3446117 RepID=UPI003EBD1B35
MFRTVMLVFGLLEFLFPKRFTNFWTRLAYTTPEEFEVRPWVVKAARIEGLVFVLLALKATMAHRAKTATEEA